VVIAAVSSDLIPEVEQIGSPAGILCGFAAGGLAMIGLKWLVLKFEKREEKSGHLQRGCPAGVLKPPFLTCKLAGLEPSC
jgi:hypothetical protein